MKTAGCWVLPLIVLLAAGCRAPATRTLLLQTGQQCWSQAHLVCPLDDLPSKRGLQGWGVLQPFWSLAGSSKHQGLVLELVYPHPEKGPQWALALLHRRSDSTQETRAGTAQDPATSKRKPALAVSKEELDRFLMALHSAQQRGCPPAANQESAGSVVTVYGTVDGQAFRTYGVPAEPWDALARKLLRWGRMSRVSETMQQVFQPSRLVQAYRRAQLVEPPLPFSQEVADSSPKKTARVFRLPGLK